MKSNRIVLGAIGLLSGLLWLYGGQGALAAYMSRVTDDSSAFRGNLWWFHHRKYVSDSHVYSILGIITLRVSSGTIRKFADFASSSEEETRKA